MTHLEQVLNYMYENELNSYLEYVTENTDLEIAVNKGDSAVIDFVLQYNDKSHIFYSVCKLLRENNIC